ncbi:hypothetical protein CCACVL1_29757 [Corchorus capsularis]|uniref:Uncharacterized protein n=1 Tax=Corchorus capsularis TaxID=210143 RepID=A0A1R3G0I0_COCAP|nr:hypothetical protein CCACVL1_29757 [Corchorus capsularis]
MYGKLGRRRQPLQSNERSRFRFASSYRRFIRSILILLAFIALLPPIYFHFRLRRFHQANRCGLKDS